MKDTEIFGLLRQTTGLYDSDIKDYRPCMKPYTVHGIPPIENAIIMQLAGNGTLVYIPDRDEKGNPIVRN